MKAKLKFMKAKFKIGDKITKEVPECLQDIYPKFPLVDCNSSKVLW